MTTRPLFAVTAITLALGATSCAAPVEERAAEAEKAGSEASALTAGTFLSGVSTVAPAKPTTWTITTGTVIAVPFKCSTSECSCSGDVDCNNMFSAGVCSGDFWSANCDLTNGVACTCAKKGT